MCIRDSSRADVPPIIATMGFMYIYHAMGYLVSHNGEWASAAALGEFKKDVYKRQSLVLSKAEIQAFRLRLKTGVKRLR